MGTPATSNPEPAATTPYGSNCFRLTLRQWLLVFVISSLIVAVTPRLWTGYETFAVEPDFRMPYELSNDYWLYQRYAGLASEKYETVLLGDSVIWGQFVTREHTLSHYLNEVSGAERFGNLGLDGAHPIALEGLVDHYAESLRGKQIVLLFNPLWITSDKADLQCDEEIAINHPRLLPQFSPSLRCYREAASPRIGIAVEQRLAFNSWANHLQMAYFEKSEIPAWTLTHPYDSLTRALSTPPLLNDVKQRHDFKSWMERGVERQNFPFVDLANSQQWKAFQRIVQTLQTRGNKVTVCIGPLNEHMLEDESLEKYRRLKVEMETWLKGRQVTYCMPHVLPSELYADLSHPLDRGYFLLAKELVKVIPQEWKSANAKP